MVKILHAFSTFNLGGPQARAVKLVEGLGDEFSHCITSMDGRFGAAELLSEAARARVQLLPCQYSKGKSIANTDQIRQLISQVKPDTVVSYNWGAIEWTLPSLDSSIRRIHVEEGFSVEESKKRLLRRNLFRAYALRKNNTLLVTVSKSIEAIARREWFIGRSRQRFIANGVNTEIYKPREHRHPNGFTLGILAGLRPEKNIARALRAFALAKQPDWKLRIAGEGPEHDALLALSRELGISQQVEFLGFCNDTPTFLKSIDAWVLSSDTEQSPISLIEAMACNLPCIATRVGDIPSMIPPTGMQLIAELNDEDLARKMSLCAELFGKQQLPNYRQHVIEHFSEAQMLQSWRSVLSGQSVA